MIINLRHAWHHTRYVVDGQLLDALGDMYVRASDKANISTERVRFDLISRIREGPQDGPLADRKYNVGPAFDLSGTRAAWCQSFGVTVLNWSLYCEERVEAALIGWGDDILEREGSWWVDRDVDRQVRRMDGQVCRHEA